MFEFEENLEHAARIKVIGIGGGGGNALKTMIRAKLEGVEFIAANTDIQTLRSHAANVKIQLGTKLTKGLGAGSNPDIGREAALEDIHTIQESLAGADMVFITAGMGGGTGTGAAPVMARLAKEMGILTVGVVTRPFSFEGRKRGRQAEEGLAELKKYVDTLIIIPTEKLLNVSGKQMPLIETFKMADTILLQAIKGISDLITIPGLINLDFADVCTIMQETGMALMGTASARGENRALEAARQAISSPLLENVSISGATGLIINITGSSSMTLFEVNEASKLIQGEAHEEAHVIFGAVIDDKMKDDIRVTVIATGFSREGMEQRPLPPVLEKRSFASFKAGTPLPPRREERLEMQSREEDILLSPLSRSLEVTQAPRTREASIPLMAERPHEREMAPRRRTFRSRDETELKQIVTEIGMGPMEDEYDIPAFIRRRAD